MQVVEAEAQEVPPSKAAKEEKTGVAAVPRPKKRSFSHSYKLAAMKAAKKENRVERNIFW